MCLHAMLGTSCTSSMITQLFALIHRNPQLSANSSVNPGAVRRRDAPLSQFLRRHPIDAHVPSGIDQHRTHRLDHFVQHGLI
jgi:hypothetical protein